MYLILFIGLYFFLLDGTISWSAIDCPGSWSDAYILDRAKDFLINLPIGVWVLGDSAFPRIPGCLERVRKKGEHPPPTQSALNFQISLERFCVSFRLSSEWGIGALKGAWKVLSHVRRLPSDDREMRITMWECVMRLHNLRVRMMRKGEATNVFIPDEFEVAE